MSEAVAERPSGVHAEGHRAEGGGYAVIDLSRVPALRESLCGTWPHDQQVQFSAAYSQVARALRHWVPGLDDEVVTERLARAVVWQALYGMRRKLNDRGLVADDDIRADLAHIGSTDGRHPS